MKEGAFRFTYFTKDYDETLQFYEHSLGFPLEHSWNRTENDKGTLFKAGSGFVEILFSPTDPSHENEGLDYRPAQGAFMCIQIWDLDERFNKYQSLGIPFKQGLTDQEWGHRSFSVIDPGGIILFFFQEQF